MSTFLNSRLHSEWMRINLLRHASMLLLSIGCTIFHPIDVTAQIGNIFGGTAINISDAPYQVSLEYDQFAGAHGCGGAIINSEWVLTAGHCADFAMPANITVHAGSTDQTNNAVGQRVEVDQIILHPDFTPFNGLTVATHDLALFHLSTPLCFNQNVQPVIFATSENTTTNDVSPGTGAFISGWGDSGNGCCNGILLGAGLPIITNAAASPMMTDPSNQCPPTNAIDNSMISLYQQGIAAGPGDSGGPAVIAGPNGIPILIGISSWGGCDRDDFPTIFANVRGLSNFVSDNITQVAPPCTCPSSITHINTNTLYDTDMDMPGDIHVHSGAELIIEAKIGMRQGTRILVERNARLVIDNGGIVTKGCDAPDWAGIQVLGNNQKVQPAYNAALTDIDQAGIVWIDYGTVEWARCGVTAGGGYGAAYWGGVVWTNNATFQKNRKDAEFMSYPFSTNKSRFTNTAFLSGMPSANTEGVTIWETDGIEFDQCRIYSKALEGIRTYDASIKVHNGCNLEGNETGISCYATYPMANTITVGTTGLENNFLGNIYDINASLVSGWAGLYSNGTFSLNIVNNNFEGSKYGVIVDGPSNFKIGGNHFTDVNIGTWVASTGYKNLVNQNLIVCNRFDSRMDIGILAIGENKEMQFLGNDFESAYTTTKDFILTNSYYPNSNGAIATFQGSIIAPTYNCFTDPGAQIDILTSGITDYFKYYFLAANVPSTCDPEPLTAGNYGKTGVSTDIFIVDCSRFGGLPSGLEDPKEEDLKGKLLMLQELLPNVGTDADEAIAALYQQTMQEKEAILKYLLTQALESGDYTTAENLIAEEENKSAKLAIFGLRMDRRDYTAASEWLEQLPVETDADAEFLDIQRINLQRLQDPENFQLSDQQEAYLSAIAESASPVRGYARGILGLLKDRRYYPEAYEFGEERSLPLQSSSTGLSDIRLYPVPASNTLLASWPSLKSDADATLEVFDLLGNKRVQQSLSPLDTQRTLQIEKFQSGVYILVITDHGTPVYRAKFSIQR